MLHYIYFLRWYSYRHNSRGLFLGHVQDTAGLLFRSMFFSSTFFISLIQVFFRVILIFQTSFCFYIAKSIYTIDFKFLMLYKILVFDVEALHFSWYSFQSIGPLGRCFL